MTFDEVVKWNRMNVNASVFADGLHKTYSGTLFINSTNETVMIGVDEVCIDVIQTIRHPGPQIVESLTPGRFYLY